MNIGGCEGAVNRGGCEGAVNRGGCEGAVNSGGCEGAVNREGTTCTYVVSCNSYMAKIIFTESKRIHLH